MAIERLGRNNHLLRMQNRNKCDKTAFSNKSLNGVSIFIAEDEFISQCMLSSFFRGSGASVTIFGNGLELLTALETSRPDLIVTDIRMPVMDGLEAVRQIREDERCGHRKSIPIIAMTAHGTPGYETTCFAAGMDAYLNKPIDLNSLASIVLTLMEKKSMSRQG